MIIKDAWKDLGNLELLELFLAKFIFGNEGLGKRAFHFMIAVRLSLQYLSLSSLTPIPLSKAGVIGVNPSSISLVKVNAPRSDSYTLPLSLFS